MDKSIINVKIDQNLYGVYRSKLLHYRVLFLNEFEGILLDDLDTLRKYNRKPNGLYEWGSVNNDLWERVDG